MIKERLCPWLHPAYKDKAPKQSKQNFAKLCLWMHPACQGKAPKRGLGVRTIAYRILTEPQIQ